jgi:hypothetical protein
MDGISGRAVAVFRIRWRSVAMGSVSVACSDCLTGRAVVQHYARIK